MAVDSTTRRVVYAGNGKTTAFPFAFKVFNATDVAVAVGANTEGSTDLAYGTDYTVALNSDQETNPGGTVTVTTAPATGYNLAITSSVPYDQPMKLTPYDGFNPETLNDNSDRQCVQIQQIKEKLDRAVVVDSTDTMTPAELKQELRNAAETAYEVASGYANQAKQSAAEAKASELSAANYAGVAEQLVPIKDAISTTAGIAEEVQTVAANRDDIATTAKNITSVNAVGQNITTVSRASGLVGHVEDIAALSPHIDDLHRVGQDLLVSDATDVSYDYGQVSDPVETVATVTGGVLKKVSDHIDDCIEPVNTEIETIKTVASHIEDCIHPVGQKLTEVEAVASHIEDCIEPVAAKLTEVHSVSTVATEVVKVSGIASEIVLAASLTEHVDDLTAAKAHIDEIHAIGQDLQGIDGASLDCGKITEGAHSTTTITSGYIKAVAEHIEDCIHPLSLELSTVEIVAKNIDSVVKAKELLEDHKADPEGHPVATQSTAGFMSAADKTKLDDTERFVDGSVTAAKLADTIDLGGF